ncbi:MAG: hypothetical protein KME03_16230 [Aphanocapsa lilacina HA4352-LM1]|jgi:hypothetical protein|nr:hypothetical protein [Aphanocapsa lilacina HA4352-LM1]
MGLGYLVAPLVLVLVVSCSNGGVQVRTPLQGQIIVTSERDAQKASRALLNKIDESVAEIENTNLNLKRAVGPTKQAERAALLGQKKALDEEVRKELQEFLAYYQRVQQAGWNLQPFDDARYFYYSYRYPDLLPKAGQKAAS